MTVVVVVAVVVVVVVWTNIGLESLPLVLLNVTHMITEVALVKLFVQNELLLSLIVAILRDTFLLSRN